MSQGDGFGSGFFLGAFVGGLVGGALGAILVTRAKTTDGENSALPNDRDAAEQDLAGEGARLSLEQKISQLNLAIDDVRQQLGSVSEGNGSNEPG
ncbi:hypothetical protein KR51_00016730 [Rubidibacter lacunae KORDI 51-2]|uniref:Gas vesicle protein n=1 Tax=Rubidibacter lacunae KORDI 51-2 TaxID=582515 RepID=U5DBA0_9CHRO|nr:hypothetical protein [Rubidibacter lacunae]ERN41818.1 hypothetical protein KR51_00016730 [Rubidibacter lacunae KORDI 51-2]